MSGLYLARRRSVIVTLALLNRPRSDEFTNLFSFECVLKIYNHLVKAQALALVNRDSPSCK